MHLSLTRVFQWSVITLVLAALVGLNYDFDSKAGMRMNAPLDDPLSQSLRGYWKLDEGTGTSTTADASGNANTLSMTGPPTWTTGTIGPSAMDFSGSGQYLSVASPASGVLDFVDGADFTLTGWFNRDLFAADHTIVAKKTDQTTNAGYVIWIDNNGGTDYLNFEISDGTDTYSVASATDFSATGWHNFAAVWDDSNGMYLYIDGGLNGSTTTSTSSIGSLANANAFRIGAESDAGVPFDGKIDDVRVYGYALSAGEVTKLYQTTAPTQPVDTGLVGHWTFDGPDIQGTTAIDRSSFGNNGIITGTTKTIGKLGQGMSFNGSNDYVDMSDPASGTLDFGTSGDFSISGWFKYAGSGHNVNTLVSKKDDYQSSKIGYMLYINVVSLRFSVSDGTDQFMLEASNNIADDTWHHVAVVWDDNSASNTRMYLDGDNTNATQTGTIGSVGNTSSTQPFHIGFSVNDGGYFVGSLDDVRIYNRTFSAAEVADLYNTGK